MSGTSSITGLDSSVLLSYYQAQLSSSPAVIASTNAANQAAPAASETNSATANDAPPWNAPPPSQTAEDAAVLSTTNFINTSNVPLTTSSTTDSKTEQDNQKLFSLYNAVNSLSTLAQMAQSSTATSGQLAGYDTRFQSGLAQIQQYIASATFNNFTLQAATPSSSVTSTATVPNASFTYATRQLTDDTNLSFSLPGLSASESFTISIDKNGTTTNVPIDLSQVQGPLTLDNVISYINQQLSAGGFTTRFQRTQQGGTPTDSSTATYGMQITPGANESVSLSAPSTPALYLVGNSGSPTDVETTTGTTTSDSPADQQGRLVKLDNLDSSPSSVVSVSETPTTGTTTAQATAVDGDGNVYVIGNATGNFGNQLNQGSQDVYLTKYDSAGNVVWSQLLGSAGSASGYSLAVDPSTGGVVVTGSSTADLTPTAVADGNTDSFVASYDANGNQTWIQQIPTLANNQSNAVSVDASGNIYIGGSVSGGVIGAGQTSQGNSDAYLAKLDSNGNIVAENQFGTSGNDSVAATATGPDGSLYVASVQNGEAIVSKYADGNISAAPTWTEDLGSLSAGGAIGGLTVSGDQVYISGTTSNANLTAGGQASIATASSGGTDAFVFNLTDNGATATADHVSYVGTSASDQGGGVTVGPDGTIYLAGTTTGTFAGQQRSVQNVNNAFVTAINPDGSIDWTQQYGGADGQSTGAGVAVDPNGASVLDALGLPSGTINLNQSVDLTSLTTLRAGDSFQIKIEGTAARTATITIDQGETLDSLIIKINAQLGSVGKASINYTGNGEDLEIAVNAGKTIELVPGPTDSDALSRLGIAAGTLSASASGSSSSSTTTATSTNTSSATPAYGLGLTGTFAISTKTGADLARSQLLSVESAIQNIYQESNAPPASPANPGQTGGTVSAYQQSQLANYNLALSLLTPSSSGSSSSSSSSTSILALF